MSTKQNDIWLETAYTTFQESLQAGQWDLAGSIMADVRDNGFEKEWQKMLQEYNHERFEDR